MLVGKEKTRILQEAGIAAHKFARSGQRATNSWAAVTSLRDRPAEEVTRAKELASKSSLSASELVVILEPY